MNKDAYRLIFEGAFDNALYSAIEFSGCAYRLNRQLIYAVQHVMLFRMLNMAYEMKIVTWEEKQWLKVAIKAIFEG